MIFYGGDIVTMDSKRPNAEAVAVKNGAIQKVGVVPGFTVGHTDYWGEAFHDHILGAERANRLDPGAAMIQQGMRFAYHSDSPVLPINPLKTTLTKSAIFKSSKPGWVANWSTRIPDSVVTPKSVPAVCGHFHLRYLNR